MKSREIPPGIIDDGWKRACEFWGTTLDIAEPVDTSKREKGDDSIAYIEMSSRQVHYNSQWFLKRDVLDCFPAVFAHELAHHMRYPHTLRVSAELMLIGHRISPGLDWSMINLFLDLLVNEHVARDPALRRQIIKMYSVIAGETKDPLYRAYLGVYESLWFGEADFKLPLSAGDRALLRNFTDTFYQLANIYEQFIYFLTFFSKYYELPKSFAAGFDPLTGDSAMPEVSDFPVDGSWSREMIDAYNRAVDEKWDENAKKIRKRPRSDDYSSLSAVMQQLAGKGQPDAPQKAALRYYLTLVEAALAELPPRIPGEKEPLEILSAAEDWEAGDDPRAIDWVESVLHGGDMAAAVPRRREVLLEVSADETDTDLSVPDFEIYLDTSGSMPSPIGAVNAMTVAALTLATYAVRKGGRVFGVVYSSGKPIISEGWMLEEQAVQTFFLNYFGGGTDFPFGTLKARSDTTAGPYRIIISDSDFIYNLSESRTGKSKNLQIVCSAAERSKALVLLFHRVSAEAIRKAKFDALLTHPRIRHISVENTARLGGVAAHLGQALLGDLA